MSEDEEVNAHMIEKKYKIEDGREGMEVTLEFDIEEHLMGVTLENKPADREVEVFEGEYQIIKYFFEKYGFEVNDDE